MLDIGYMSDLINPGHASFLKSQILLKKGKHLSLLNILMLLKNT